MLSMRFLHNFSATVMNSNFIRILGVLLLGCCFNNDKVACNKKCLVRKRNNHPYFIQCTNDVALFAAQPAATPPQVRSLKWEFFGLLLLSFQTRSFRIKPAVFLLSLIISAKNQ